MSKPTIIVTHSSGLQHDTGAFHPESPDRLRSVLKALDQSIFKSLPRENAPEATPEQIARAHPGDFIKKIMAAMPREGLSHLDPDTVVSPGSGQAVLRAAGAVVSAVDAVAQGKARNAFCAVRPPGHHAESHRAMGFCVVNNIAVGAYHARAVPPFSARPL